MTTSDESTGDHTAAVGEKTNGPGVLCTRCDHLNPLGVEDCEECDAPLYVKCPACGATTQRIYTRCTNCHQRLQKGRFRKTKSARHKRSSTSSVGQIGRRFLWTLGVLGVLTLGAGLLLYYVKMK